MRPRRWIRNLQPTYFALVMATSIVAIGCDVENLARIAKVLTGLNAGAFVLLVALTLARLVAFRDEVWADITSHARAPGFLTIPAGSALLGCQLILITGRYPIAFILWIAAVASWILLTYTIFATFTVKKSKPPLEQGTNGGWLLAVVSTQAIAQLALLLIPAYTCQDQKLRKRKSRVPASTFSRIARSGRIRAISTDPIMVEKITKKARSLSAVRWPGMNGNIRLL